MELKQRNRTRTGEVPYCKQKRSKRRLDEIQWR